MVTIEHAVADKEITSPPILSGGCREECDTLRHYHTALVEHYPQLTATFSAWNEKLCALADRSDLETIETERTLGQLAMEFRALWLRAVHFQLLKVLKSPPHRTVLSRPNGDRHQFPYARWADPSLFEQAYGKSLPQTDGWRDQHLFFGNAMSALTSFLLTARHAAWFPMSGPLTVLGCHGYFEIETLMTMLSGHDYAARMMPSQCAVNDAIAIGIGDAVMIEPVYANVDLTVWDENAFLDAWAQRPNTATTTLLIDTSLVGTHFDMSAFLAKLSNRPPALVAQVTSAIKLHQLGMEFTNLGVLSLYIQNQTNYAKAADTFIKKLKLTRQTCGTGATFDEYSTIDFSMLAQTDLTRTHCQRVFDNNAQLARDLSGTGGLFSSVAHPVLKHQDDIDWAVAPYVMIQLSDGDRSDKAFFHLLLGKLAFDRGLALEAGSSFGFRSHRFEMGCHDKTPSLKLRVAMGALKGPSYQGIVQLLRDIAAYADMQALKDAFPDIRPVPSPA